MKGSNDKRLGVVFLFLSDVGLIEKTWASADTESFQSLVEILA
jgi:hypothetical protein